MHSYKVLEKYIQICSDNLVNTPKVLNFLKKNGIYESFIFENFQLGFSNGEILKQFDDTELMQILTEYGIAHNGKDIFTNHLIIPIVDENKKVINLIGYNIFPQAKQRLISLNNEGVFNHIFLSKTEKIYFTANPVEALSLIHNDYSNSTFLFGNEEKYTNFVTQYNIREIVFTFEGKVKLFYELTRKGILTARLCLDFAKSNEPAFKAYLDNQLTTANNQSGQLASDKIIKIENGFLFKFDHLNYRIIGNFAEYAVTLKVNIKAFTDNEVFVDSLDLFKNRARQTFIYNLMDRFQIRDQLQLENDFNQIMDIIEKHKETMEKLKKQVKPELTEHQQKIGLDFLKQPDLIAAIQKDYTALGYLCEDTNKALLYLIMTSRLMDKPLQGIIISRSAAGKSLLAETTEEFCPPEDTISISDLSAQALYYFGEDDLKHKFIVIGEKEGSDGADYPLRELISRKSITKAIPVKDPVTKQIKTISVKVNGPIALVETSTATRELNHENLNRCFVLSIDESAQQTRLIHQLQRKNYTFTGYLEKEKLDKLIDKHIFAQRLLKPVLVFNPYAELLTFPSSKLKSRRDNDKLLRLINVICFLHQYQRKVKKAKLKNDKVVEYIECTAGDYRIAYSLLINGVLDNTLDDLSRPARKLLEHIKQYLKEWSEKDNIPIEKIIFERKDIREYTSWSFAQVRDNIRILTDYEYLQLVRSKNGTAKKYKLSSNYSDLDFLKTILSPEELKNRICEKDLVKTT